MITHARKEADSVPAATQTMATLKRTRTQTGIRGSAKQHSSPPTTSALAEAQSKKKKKTRSALRNAIEISEPNGEQRMPNNQRRTSEKCDGNGLGLNLLILVTC